MPNPAGINQYTKGGGKRASGKISSLQKTRVSIKKSIGAAEKKSEQSLGAVKRNMVREATKHPSIRGSIKSNAFHIGKGK